jgi:hypothetical protein
MGCAYPAYCALDRRLPGEAAAAFVCVLALYSIQWLFALLACTPASLSRALISRRSPPIHCHAGCSGEEGGQGGIQRSAAGLRV